MTIYLEDEHGFFEQYSEIYEDVQNVIKLAVKAEEVPYEVEVSLTIVTEKEIQEINECHRGIDKVTDVLSFPQIEAAQNGGIIWDDIDEASHINHDTKELILGDIVLCDEVAKIQSANYGHTLRREICFLVAHSMFHLLGYDHMTKEEELVMVKKQEEILQKLCIER
ncbi:MAG: rRNA maturation RNase YbeY [Cellulosilyticaceae bacterium]